MVGVVTALLHVLFSNAQLILGQRSFNIACAKFHASPLVLAADLGSPLWPIRKEFYSHFFDGSLKSVRHVHGLWEKLLTLQL